MWSTTLHAIAALAFALAGPLSAAASFEANDVTVEGGAQILGRELVVTEVLGQTQDRGYRVKVSWRLRLHSPDARDQRATIRLDFRNAHDLLLRTIEKTFTVPASGTQLFEGFDELTLGTAEETASIDAKVTSSRPVG